tara:strand:- start:1110 stop:1619 length:510 start_codon:yes stop_codon:yes gene_type:complete
MKIKILVLSLITILMSCKKTQDDTLLEHKNVSKEITEKDLSKLDFIEFTLDVKTKKAIENWQEYHQLQDVITNVKKGDLSFFSDNKEGIKTLFKDLLLNIPDQVNNDATLARIVALETKLYKLESLSNLSTTSKEELSLVIQEFLESFSNLNFQMNKKIEKDNQNIEKP